MQQAELCCLKSMGHAVALSSDGNTALLGIPDRDQARIYVRSGETWAQQGPDFRPGTGGNEFGSSVALSGDGNTALVGAPTALGDMGVVYMFVRSGSEWGGGSLQLEGEDFERYMSSRLGSGVALSGDGQTALVGAESFGAIEESGVFAFTRTELRKFTEQGRALVGEGRSGEMGKLGTLTLSDDGNTALFTVAGKGRVFTRSAGVWTQQAEGLGSEIVAVALSADGNTALLSSDFKTHVYTRSAGVWTQQAEFSSGTRTESLAVSGDGNTALLGTPETVRVFTHSSAGWTQQQELSEPGEAFVESGFGTGVALSADGQTVLVGAPLRPVIPETSEPKEGYGFVFVAPPTVAHVSPASGPEEGGTVVTITGTHLGGARSVKFGAANATSFTVNSESSLTAVAPAAAAGTVDVTVTALATSTPSEGDRFRYFHVPAEALPELGRCAPTSGFGLFTGASCLPKSSEDVGPDEWSPGPGPSPHFSGEIPETVIETTGGARVTCGLSSLTGEWTGPKGASVTLTLRGCRNATGKSCQSSPTHVGEITTEGALEGVLGFIRGGSNPKAGLDLKPSGAVAVTLAQFTCGELLEAEIWTLKGSVIGRIAPLERMSPKFTLLYTQVGGKQSPEHLEGAATDRLTAGRVVGGPEKQEQAGLTMRRSAERKTVVAVNAERLEIKALP